jgi:hypothetical protein
VALSREARATAQIMPHTLLRDLVDVTREPV